MKDMWAMMKGFLKDWWRYRSEVKKQDLWIKKVAANRGWSVNPHWMMFTNLKLWIIDSEKMFGRRYCPCFEPSGDAELDRKLICPCEFAQGDIDEKDACHCTLFGKGDMTAADWKRVEARLMDEYRGTPLKLDGTVLDTRGHEVEPRRGLIVPDALHQTKRALGMIGPRLEVIVSSAVEAEHLERLGASRGWGVTVEDAGDHRRVRFTPGTIATTDPAIQSSCSS